MNQISNLYRIIAFTLALLMFSTSVSFAIDMHYCGDNLKTVNFFGKAKNCLEMAKLATKKSCAHPHHQEAAKQNKSHSIAKKDCCTNKLVQFQSDQDQELRIVDFTLNKQVQQFVTAFVVSFLTTIPVKKEKPSFALYKPPLIPRDIPVLIQSFLL